MERSREKVIKERKGKQLSVGAVWHPEDLAAFCHRERQREELHPQASG